MVPGPDAEPEAVPREQRPEASQGRDYSPVTEGRDRSRTPMILAFVAIAGVFAFLFVTSGANTVPATAAPPPQLASRDNSGALDRIPDPPPLPPAPEVPAGLPSPPTPSEPDSRARNKEEARRHAPMLVYDRSERDNEASTTSSGAHDELADLHATMTAATVASASSNGHAAPEAPAPSRADAHSQRTQEFARSTSAETVPVATAQRIELHNRIAQGKTLAATLETAISSDLPGKLRAIVGRDVWSEDGQQRLILRGSRLIGDYRAGLAHGQTRVFVIWTRLLQPDGTDIALGSPGTDDLGRAGLSGQVDRHFVERFGAALLLSVIGSSAVIAQDGNSVVIDTSRSAAGVANDMLADSADIPPTVTVAQGAPVQVFVSRDLVFEHAPQRP